MKDSGVDWIGEIPQEWELQRLRFLCSITTGDKDTVDRVDNGKYPFYVRSPNIERIDTFSYDGEAILMAGDGVGAGKAFHYANGKFDYHQRVYNLHAFNIVYGKFLYYYLIENFWKKIEESNAKSTVDSVRLPMLLNFFVAFGTSTEQTCIVNFLDTKCSKIDRTIELQKTSIEKLKAYKQSVITEAVTKGLNPNVPMKDSGVKWIGEIPLHWDLLKLATMCDRDITYGIVKLGEYDDNGVSVLRCSDVQAGYIDLTNVRTVTNSLSDQYKRTILSGGEIVINVRGTLGGCAVVPPELKGFNIAREVAVIPISVDYVSRYVMYSLLSHCFTGFQEYSLRGVVYVGLNINLLSSYLTMRPPVTEQQSISDYLDVKCAAIDSAISKKETLIDKLTAYKKSLIYEAVTGKVEIKAA